MDLEIEQIFISKESYEDANTLGELEKENSDVVVLLNNYKKYTAAFFTYDNIKRLSQDHQVEGSFLKGEYFWNKNMILTRSIDRKTIRRIVDHLLEEGDFIEAFNQVSP